SQPYIAAADLDARSQYSIRLNRSRALDAPPEQETDIMDADTTVLIVGGSLNGLSAALLLAHRGVSCSVVERHPGTSIQYKFRGISPRSMEIYRNLGIE